DPHVWVTMPALPEPPDATAPMPAVTPGSRHGSGGTSPRRSLGTVDTLCLTALILVSLCMLGIGDLPRAANVLALIVGAGSAGILLGPNKRLGVHAPE